MRWGSYKLRGTLVRARAIGLAVASLLLLTAAGDSTAVREPSGKPANPPPALLLAQPVTIGPLALDATPAADGRTVFVRVQLQNVTVGAQTLAATDPIYTFAVTVGTTKASGSLTALFMPPGQLSTVTASVTVEVQGQAKEPFAGLVQGFRVPPSDGH